MSTSQKYWVTTKKIIPENNRQILNDFLLSLKLANKAVVTITKYKWVLEKFLSECSVSIKVRCLSLAEICRTKVNDKKEVL